MMTVLIPWELTVDLNQTVNRFFEIQAAPGNVSAGLGCHQLLHLCL